VELLSVGYEADGLVFTGYLADGSRGEAVPGILVIHEGGGLTEETRSRTLRIAGLGYVAFAMDLFGEPVVELDRAREIVGYLRGNVAALRARCRAALDVVRAQPGTDRARLGAIGFCIGGAAAIELARDGAELACVVGFHSGFIEGPPAEDDRNIRAKLLLCQGAADPIVTSAQREAFVARMTDAGIDWQLHLYGGVGHSFTNPQIDDWQLAGFAYDALADRRSWAAMLSLFGEVFGPPTNRR
jgi:dienelactone hydrolase